ncbi:type II toxin-antitoxin system HicB family antitoxin [Salegentibacter sp. LM13S]|uniref:type II toxin-antitoxin system HicB family antitoxin n=1 Tax=Salegentibacter lacus TaxID=2873599 RepID=UPI001CCA2AF6|nr:type II toxin-antitoxin system HicB family antitoxin [Salegentibacter lacus]MBZ9632082.1 type II toxin-antitoxin system HicB family antitoxin [Salegentibacter lacus]
MKKVEIYVEKAEDGTYWGSTQNIPGGVSAFGSSLDELKQNLRIAFQDYKEVAEDLNEDWLNEIKDLNEFEYKLDIASFFKLLPIKISAIAEKTGINPSLMRQYASGKANASEERARKIEKAIHELGEDLLSISI